ncbi:MAG: hypothetical protein ABIH39_01355, partial [Candidatus Margulisiibacteriota bacterium]
MNLPFSKRHGYKEVSNVLQVESMSDDLRNSLWNCMVKHYFNENNAVRGNNGYGLGFKGPWLSETLYTTIEQFWINYLKKPVDQINDHWDTMNKIIRDMFFMGDWHFVYDLIEFFANNNYEDFHDRYYGKTLLFADRNSSFINLCNKVLETECAGYRFVDGYITPITDPVEITEIETAVSTAQRESQTHFKKALQALSDKNGPETKYKDCIRESIHAVEAVCNKISSQNTLGDALKEIARYGVKNELTIF